jgi:bacteriorhodopsin
MILFEIHIYVSVLVSFIHSYHTMVHDIQYLQIDMGYVHVKKKQRVVYIHKIDWGGQTWSLILHIKLHNLVRTLKSELDINFENLKKFGLLQYFVRRYFLM